MSQSVAAKERETFCAFFALLPTFLGWQMLFSSDCFAFSVHCFAFDEWFCVAPSACEVFWLAFQGVHFSSQRSHQKVPSHRWSLRHIDWFVPISLIRVNSFILKFIFKRLLQPFEVNLCTFNPEGNDNLFRWFFQIQTNTKRMVNKPLLMRSFSVDMLILIIRSTYEHLMTKISLPIFHSLGLKYPVWLTKLQIWKTFTVFIMQNLHLAGIFRLIPTFCLFKIVLKMHLSEISYRSKIKENPKKRRDQILSLVNNPPFCSFDKN